MKYLFIISLLFLSSLYADIPEGYYDGTEGLTGEDLKTALHDIIDDHVEFPYTSTSTDTWEPREAVKGDVARMIFYMATRYEGDNGEVDLEVVDYAPSSPNHEPVHGVFSTLMEWHVDDPVDEWEENRNDIIYEDYQENRNPFIDHPEYVAQIWNDNGTFLPVILSSFSVTFSSGNPLISWTTQSESNSSNWNIYRSISQNLGQAIWLNESQIIPGQGSTSEPTNYTFSDLHPIVEFTTFYYWIESIDFSGETDLYGPVSLYIPAGGSNNGTPIAPEVYGLLQNYPNPFNPQTIVSFVFQEDTQAELSVFNIKGKFIKTLFQGITPADNIQYVSWNGADFTGKKVSSGTYFYQLKTPLGSTTKKMLLLK